jgi:hypothetical protein
MTIPKGPDRDGMSTPRRARGLRYLPCPCTTALLAAGWLLWPSPPQSPVLAHLAECPRCENVPDGGPQPSPAACPGMRALMLSLGWRDVGACLETYRRDHPGE